MPNININQAIERIAGELERTKDHALYNSGIPLEHASQISLRLDDIEAHTRVLRELVIQTLASRTPNSRNTRRR